VTSLTNLSSVSYSITGTCMVTMEQLHLVAALMGVSKDYSGTDWAFDVTEAHGHTWLDFSLSVNGKPVQMLLRPRRSHPGDVVVHVLVSSHKSITAGDVRYALGRGLRWLPHLYDTLCRSVTNELAAT
jgi:hypothetical protein